MKALPWLEGSTETLILVNLIVVKMFRDFLFFIFVFSVCSRFLAAFQVQEVDRKVEEIKAVISVYWLSKSVFRVPSYTQKTVWS